MWLYGSMVSINSQTCLNAVGEIDKQTIGVEDAWYVEYNYSWGGYYDTTCIAIRLSSMQ